MPLRATLTNTWDHLQGFLFPMLRAEVGPLTPQHERLVIVLDVARIEAFVPVLDGWPGRPPKDRHALARAFVAKAVCNIPTTEALIERLAVDQTLRRLCGYEFASQGTRSDKCCIALAASLEIRDQTLNAWRTYRCGNPQVPDASTFSRAFAEFANSALPSHVHAALIKETHKDRLVGHISRVVSQTRLRHDATAIEARETPVRAGPPAPAPAKRKRGRPKKGEVVAKKEPRRLERQATMTLAEMLADLPTVCSVGTKRNAKGHTTSWIGYKLHIDTADGDVPITCLLTSASVHDSQVAIPLAIITAGRVDNLYDLMDSACDAPEIHAKSIALGHKPIIDPHTKRGCKADTEREARARRLVGFVPAEAVRYRERSSAEPVNGALKDSYGGRFVRVRGHAKVRGHLMFGILAQTVEQLMRLVT